MMKLLAGAFAGFTAMMGGLFGMHDANRQDDQQGTSSFPAEQHDGIGSSTDRMHGGTGRGEHMGSTTQDHMFRTASSSDGAMGAQGARGIIGVVSSVSGSSFVMQGHAGMNSATTTYTVDTSSAKIMKKNVAISVSDIVAGDTVLVAGPLSGTSIKASIVIDGIPPRSMMQPGSTRREGAGRAKISAEN